MLTAEAINGFTRSVLAARYDAPKPVPPFHDELWMLCCSDERQVAISAPRGHAKSTAITFAYVVACITFREHRHILVLSANEEIASSFVSDIKTEFNENELLRDISGFEKWHKDSETEIIGKFKDGAKFRVVAKGANQRMRGMKWERKRPDLVIGDDLEDDEIVLNKDRRAKFKKWFYGAVKPILGEGGKIRLVGTIVHMDSLLENLMPKLHDKDTVIEPLRIWSEKPHRAWRSVKYRAHSPEYEEILWPEKFPVEELERIRQDYAEQGILDIYGQEYLNDPIDDSTAFFKEEDFLDMPDHWNDTPKKYYAAVDFAISTTDKRDFTVIAVVGVDALGYIGVEHVRKGRWDSTEIMENMFQVNRRFDPEVFVAEQGQIQKSIGPFLYSEMRRRGEYINLHTMVPTKDKQKRATSIQGRMRAGSVYFDKEAAWYPDLHEEMRRFPKAPHDDQVDALAWIGLLLNDMVYAQTQEEIEEEEYWRDYESTALAGRNFVTGY